MLPVRMLLHLNAITELSVLFELIDGGAVYIVSGLSSGAFIVFSFFSSARSIELGT